MTRIRHHWRLSAFGNSFHSSCECDRSPTMSPQQLGTEGPKANGTAAYRRDTPQGRLWFQQGDGGGQRFGLDTVNQCLWKQVPETADRRILLTPKAFAVLRHLVHNAGRLVTHEE